jgi:hypothetical protein
MTVKRPVTCLRLKPSLWVPPELPEMDCLCSAQQRPPEHAQSAWAPAPQLSGPPVTFCLSPPHFRISRLHSADVRCGEPAHHIIPWHFDVVLNPIDDSHQDRCGSSPPLKHVLSTATEVVMMHFLQLSGHIPSNCTSDTCDLPVDFLECVLGLDFHRGNQDPKLPYETSFEMN